MQTFLSVLLLVNALFSLVVWPRFFGRIAKDPRARDSAGRPTRFLVVHVVLIVVAVVLGIVSAVAGIWGLVA